MKWLLIFLLSLLIGGSIINLSIPTEIHVSSVSRIEGSENAFSRVIIENRQNWQNWWPGKKEAASSNRYFFNGFVFEQGNYSATFIEILISKGVKNTISNLLILPTTIDSTAIQWETVIPSSRYNPINKLSQYFFARSVKNRMDEILRQLEKYLSNTENIYSFNIQRTKVTDTLLICTKTSLPAYPTTADVYTLVELLETDINDSNGKAANTPMLHINQTENGQFEMMVALPLLKEIPVSNKTFIKRMFPGNILMAEVTGGPATIQHAYKELLNFKLDFGNQSPAKAFELLLTNRLTATDTSTWKTKVYLPIF